MKLTLLHLMVNREPQHNTIVQGGRERGNELSLRVVATRYHNLICGIPNSFALFCTILYVSGFRHHSQIHDT